MGTARWSSTARRVSSGTTSETGQRTLRNISKVADQGKPAAVYVSPMKRFVTVRSTHDASILFRDMQDNVATSKDLFSDTWQPETEQASQSLDLSASTDGTWWL